MAQKKNPNLEGEKITTIKLLEETKNRLEKLREYKKESFDDVLRKILYILNVTREDPEKAKKILEKISEVRARAAQEEQRQNEDLKKEKESEKKSK